MLLETHSRVELKKMKKKTTKKHEDENFHFFYLE